MDFQKIFDKYDVTVSRDGAYTLVKVNTVSYEALQEECPELRVAKNAPGASVSDTEDLKLLWLYIDSIKYDENIKVRELFAFLQGKTGKLPAPELVPVC